MAVQGGNTINGMMDPNDGFQTNQNGGVTAPNAGINPATYQFTGAQAVDPSAFMSGYQQRGKTPGSGVVGGAAKGALGGATTGALLGSKIGMIGGPVGMGIGAGVGALGGVIGGLMNKHAASAATDYSVNDAKNIISQAYQQYEGKPITQDYLNQVLAGQGLKPGGQWVGSAGLTGVLNALRGNAVYDTQQQQANQPPASGSSGSGSDSSKSTDYSSYNTGLGMPSWLSDIYNKAGVKANDRGAGFTDWQYWADKPDQAQRLAADLAGSGPDKPGPLDSGASLGSGAGGSAGGATGMGGGDYNSMMYQMLNNLLGQVGSPMPQNFTISNNMGITPPSQTTLTPTAIMQSLMK